MRIRHYGLFANRCRREKLVRIRSAIEQVQPQAIAPDMEAAHEDRSVFDDYPCPRCGNQPMRVIGEFVPRRLAGGYG